MAGVLKSGREPCRADQVELAVAEAWRQAPASLAEIWGACDPARSLNTLSAAIKTDMRVRAERGLDFQAALYLDQFSLLRDCGERVLSLIYEEYCLREERGEAVDPESFCARYSAWHDSIASQIRYHQVLSRAAKPEPLPHFPEPGDYFEEFHLQSVLGVGGAARVYLAVDKALGDRIVALKVSLDRGLEPAILGPLSHPHIVPVHSISFSDSGLRGLCMPYQPGLPLDEVLKRLFQPKTPPSSATSLRGELPVLAPVAAPKADEARSREPAPTHTGWDGFPTHGDYSDGIAWIAARLAEALAHAHSREVWHRDVKPANILLTSRDGPLLLDFNLARHPFDVEHARDAMRGGTPSYMAPEQLEAFLDSSRWSDVGPLADIYSLGLVIREMLTGAAPEPPSTSLPLPRAIQDLLDRRSVAVDDARSLNKRVPHALDAIVARCIRPEPADRYQSAADLAEDLERFRRRRPLRHAVNPSLGERAGNWLRHRAAVLVAIAAVLVALAAVVIPPVSRALFPPERRSTFVHGLGALRRDRAADALVDFEQIAREYPGSPVPMLAESLALAKLDRYGDAARRFASALALAEGEAVVSRSADSEDAFGLREHIPALFGRVTSRLNPALERFALGLVLRSDPNRRAAALQLAIRDESDGCFSSAEGLLQDLGDQLDGGTDDQEIDRKRLSLIFGRVLLKHSEQLLRLGTVSTYHEAAELLRRAREQFRICRSLPGTEVDPGEFFVGFLETKVEIAHGDLEAIASRPAAALESYQTAKKLVLRLISPTDQVDRLERLRREIDARLTAMGVPVRPNDVVNRN